MRLGRFRTFLAAAVALALLTIAVPSLAQRNVGECNDGVDNDGDGLVDARGNGDPGCASRLDAGELGENACDNGLDDDLDGRVDWREDAEAGDPGCATIFDDVELGTLPCDDGLDNDGDGTLDFRLGLGPWDAGCEGPDDTSERGAAACDDGVDNDGDGFADFHLDPALGDPHCVGPHGVTEGVTPETCDDDALEENDDTATATFLGSLGGGQSIERTLNLCPEDEDWFRVVATETSTEPADIRIDVRIEFSHAAGDLALQLYAGGVLIASSDSTTDVESVSVARDDTFGGDDTTTYHIRVLGGGGASVPYLLRVLVTE